MTTAAHLPATTFLTSLVGNRVALVRDRHAHVVGTLADVVDSGDPDHPILVVDIDGATVRVPAADLTRIKFHFNPTDKDAR